MNIKKENINKMKLCFKVKSPSQLSDLNPIELMWADLKHFIRLKQCKTVNEIAFAVKEYHNLLTPEKCAAFISHFRKVLIIII